jgi:hypothetical protein
MEKIEFVNKNTQSLFDAIKQEKQSTEISFAKKRHKSEWQASC